MSDTNSEMTFENGFKETFKPIDTDGHGNYLVPNLDKADALAQKHGLGDTHIWTVIHVNGVEEAFVDEVNGHVRPDHMPNTRLKFHPTDQDYLKYESGVDDGVSVIKARTDLYMWLSQTDDNWKQAVTKARHPTGGLPNIISAPNES